jgi:cytochrome d ubiquinol oxidase subunit I
MGLIATRSTDREVAGIEELVSATRAQIKNGLIAHDAIEKLRNHPTDDSLRAIIDEHSADLGSALLLKRIRPDIENATEAEIDRAAQSTIPDVPVLFWSFRLMVGFGFWFMLLFATAFLLSTQRRLDRYPVFLIVAMASLPFPWIAAELGWIVSEYGRQPWAIVGVLPTRLAASSTDPGNVVVSLIVFAAFYTSLLAADLYLLRKYIRIGPREDSRGSRAAPIVAMRPGE